MPTIRQRLVIGVAIGVAALAFLALRGLLEPADGSQGISLLEARVGVGAGVALVLGASAAGVVLGSFAAATGSFLAGPFVMGVAMAILAAAAGPIDDYLRATAMPKGYLLLAGESLVWLAIWVVSLPAMLKLSARMRKAIPGGWVSETWETGMAPLRGWEPWAGGAICAAVAAVAIGLLVRSSDAGQVLFSVFIAFCVGGLAARSALGPVNPVVVLLSPAAVAAGTYLWAATQYGDWQEVLSVWYRLRMPGLALVLPIYHFSAGVAGAAIGIGWGQMLAAPKSAQAA